MKNRHITFVTILLALASFGFLPGTKAVSPAPDGGYPGGNTAEGQNALLSLTSGTYNTAVGFLGLWSNTTGNFNTGLGAGTLLANTADQNTATGAGALLSNATGASNSAHGAFALFSNTIGNYNTAIGESALFNNTEGDQNTACGTQTLFSNTTGAGNTATGAFALYTNTTGVNNTAVGSVALTFNANGAHNTAVGHRALVTNSSGTLNTAIGAEALFNNTTGELNTAIGATALLNNVNGIANTAVGYQALLNSTGSINTAIGENALQHNTTGTQNVALGVGAGSTITTANNVICIGSQIGGENISNSCFIGNIRGVPTGIGDAVSVVIDSNGQLGTLSSSRRFKKDIIPMDETSEAILALKPVTFHYKSHNDTTPQFGLIAEEVAEANPDLVVRDKEGKPFTVRYDQVNAMLLNEFLKDHRKVKELEKVMASLTTQLKEQAAQIQKVSAQVEMNRAVSRKVANK